MGCFSLAFWEQLCIFIVVVMVVWYIINLLLPYLLQFLPSLVVAIIRIVIWGAIAIFVIKLIFDLLSCLIGSGGGLSFPHH